MRFSRIAAALTAAALACGSAAWAQGAGTDQTAEAMAAATTIESTTVPEKPNLVFYVRGGVDTTPDYFGSANNTVFYDWAIKPAYIRLGKLEFGNPDPPHAKYGFRIKPAFRITDGRDPLEHPELLGTYELPPSIELGIGAVYLQRKFQIYAEARYGLFGHETWVGEIGGDYYMYPNDSLKLWIGPRFTLGTNGYVDKWYGIDALEAQFSPFPVYDPSPGLVRAGIEMGATYDIHHKWDFEAALTYERLVGGAADSPIVRQVGSEEQLSARIGFVRRFTWRF